MKVSVGAATDVGLVREGNEDAYLTVDRLFAVADGMGGHRGGEVASQLAMEILDNMFRRGEGDLTEQVQEANRAVFERSMLDRRVAGMGTTLTAVLVEGDHIRLAHVGDSRAYLLRQGELRLLTEDHTLVHRMVVDGEITEREAETHPQRSILTRALGVDLWVDVDDGLAQVQPGDRLLLCTDGLTGMVHEEEMGRILLATSDPQEAAERLVRAANEAGGVDNTTVVVLDFAEDDPPGEAGSEAAASEGLGLVSAGQAPPSPRSAEASPEPEPSSVQARSTTSTMAAAALRSGEGDGMASGAKPSQLPRRAFPVRKVAIWVGAVVAVIVVGLVGLRLYVDSQWYVGVSDGRVAIYKGIPTGVAGFRLHHVVVETTIPADLAESLVLWRNLDQGITAEDRPSANAIVEQIRKDVERSQQNAPKPPSGSGS